MESTYYVTHLDSVTDLYAGTAALYRSMTIENYTGKMLYAMFPDGSIQEIPPYPNWSSVESKAVISTFTRLGTEPIPAMNTIYTTESPKYPIDKYNIPVSNLDSDAIYVREVGVAIATAELYERLPMVHELNCHRYTQMMKDIVTDYFQRDWPVICAMTVNTHNPDVEYMYVKIGDTIGSVKVRHDYNEEESVIMYLNRGDGHTRITFNYDFSGNDVVHENARGVDWCISTRADKILGVIESAKSRLSRMVTIEELKMRIAEETKALETTVNQLQKELATTKRDLDIARAEVDRANTIGKLTTDQQLQALKLQTAFEEKNVADAKKNEAREMLLLKNEADLSIAKAKVEKEQLSVQGASLSNEGTAWKVAAAIIPAAIGAGVWIAKALSGLTPIGAGLSTCSTALSLGSRTLSIGTALAHTGGRIIRGVGNVIKDICTGTYNVICSVGRYISDAIFSWF